MHRMSLTALVGACLATAPAFAQPRPVPAQPLGKVILGEGSSGDITAACARAPGSALCRSASDRAGDRLNARDKGAVLNGVASDNAGLSAARAAGANRLIAVPAGTVNLTAPPCPSGASGVAVWGMDGVFYPGGTVPVLSTGCRGDLTTNYFNGTAFFGRSGSTPATGPVMRVDGVVDHAGGAVGPIHTLEVNSIYGDPAAPGQTYSPFAWGITSVLSTYAKGGESAAVYGQAIKNVAGGTIFAGVDEAHDRTGKSSGEAGVVVSREVDLTANGADNCTVPAYGCRIALDIVIAQSPTVTGDAGKNQVGTVMRIGARPNEGSIKTVFRGINATPVSDSVLDTTGFVFGPQAVALKLAQGQLLALDARASDGGYARTLGVSGNLLQYIGPSGGAMSVDDAGNLNAAGRMTATAGFLDPNARTPASATAPCTTGQQAWDTSYEYRCVSTNRWRRIAYASDWP